MGLQMGKIRKGACHVGLKRNASHEPKLEKKVSRPMEERRENILKGTGGSVGSA